MTQSRLTYYAIYNTAFDGTYQGDWSEQWMDTELTDFDEAKKLFEEAKKDWSIETFEAHNVEKIDLVLDKCFLPIDEDGDYDFNNQDANTLEVTTLYKGD